MAGNFSVTTVIWSWKLSSQTDTKVLQAMSGMFNFELLSDTIKRRTLKFKFGLHQLFC